MEDYKSKYLKYKNKYLLLKKQLGGRLLNYKLDETNLSDDLYVLSYHGATDTRNYFNVPDNIILVLSNCCGSSNYANLNGWNNPTFEKINHGYIPEKEFYSNKVNKGKMIINGQEYLVIDSGSNICDIDLSVELNDFATGTHKKKVENDILFYEINEKNLTNYKDSYDVVKFVDFLLYQKDNNINLGDMTKSKKIKNLMKNIRTKFSIDLNEKISDPTEFLERLKNEIKLDWFDGDNIQDFIYDISNRNYIFYIFNIIFLYFIKNKNDEYFKLSYKLEQLSLEKGDTKKSIVFLYACQGSSSSVCRIDNCYKKLLGQIDFNKELEKIIPKYKIKEKCEIDLSREIIIDPEFIFNKRIAVNKFLDNIRGIDNYFINILDKNRSFLDILISTCYDFIQNKNVITDDEGYDIYLLGNLLNGKNELITKTSLISIYFNDSWNFILKNIINNNSYLDSFSDIFEGYLNLLLEFGIFQSNEYDLYDNYLFYLNDLDNYNELFMYFYKKKFTLPISSNNFENIKAIIREFGKENITRYSIKIYFYSITPTKRKYNYNEAVDLFENSSEIKKEILKAYMKSIDHKLI